MSSFGTAAVTAVTFVALFAGHQIGDHIAQRNVDAAAKGAPTPERLAAGEHPWTGWRACLRHVGTYTLAQVVALALVSIAAPMRWYGTVAAVIVSACTHAVIDRRWIVRAMVRAKRCQHWTEGPYHIDQSLHFAALLVAALLAAVTATKGAVGAVALCAAGLVGVTLVVERRLGSAARDTAADMVRR
jgi:hypothetical protein